MWIFSNYFLVIPIQDNLSGQLDPSILVFQNSIIDSKNRPVWTPFKQGA